MFSGRLFSRKKPPGGHAGGLAKGGGITKIGFRCPKSQNVVWKPTGLTKRFLHVQNPKMSFGNLLGLAKRGLDPKSENAVWKPTGASKEVLRVQNPKMSFGNLLGLTKMFF